jgi:hypothetical protein
MNHETLDVSEDCAEGRALRSIKVDAFDQLLQLSTSTCIRSLAPIAAKARKVDALMRGTDPDDKNNVGSTFMKSVRREA